MSLKNRFPSYQMALAGMGASAMRFPLTLLSAIIGTVMAVIIADAETFDGFEMQKRVILCASLGIPLFVALQTFSEKLHWSAVANYLLQSLSVVALILYYYSLPDDLSALETFALRHFLLALGLHFLVAWLPFVGDSDVNGFWQYNKTLFLRFLTATLFSAALHTGLAIALGAAEHLFDLEVEGVRYFQLWIIIAGIFQTWFFLAGVPDDFDKLARTEEYPKGLKIFAQFILLPLVGLYWLILYAYEAKIIIAWNWPRGWVSELILWYAVVGILSLLLLHPLRNKTENRWIKVFSKGYFLALVPLLVMLILAIARRVSEYGITEPRYLVLALALGLTAVVSYFIASKAKDIRIIPIVLTVLAFVSAIGPFSAQAVSLRSQQARFETLLIETGLWKDGALTHSSAPIQLEKQVDLSNLADHLATHYGRYAFEKWLDDSATIVLDSTPEWKQGKVVAGAIGFQYEISTNNQRSAQLTDGHFNLSAPTSDVIYIAGYDFLIEHVNYGTWNTCDSFAVSNMSLIVTFDTLANEMRFTYMVDSANTMNVGVAIISLHQVITDLLEARELDPELERLAPQPFSAEGIEGMLLISSIRGTMKNDSLTLRNVSGKILLKGAQ